MKLTEEYFDGRDGWNTIEKKSYRAEYELDICEDVTISAVTYDSTVTIWFLIDEGYNECHLKLKITTVEQLEEKIELAKKLFS